MENSGQIKINPYRAQSVSERNNEFLNTVYYERPEKLALLIEAGVDLESMSQGSDVTPLMYAAANGRLLNVALLIKAGANLEAKTSRQETALFSAIKKNHLRVGFLLFNAMSSEQLNEEINLHAEIKPILDCFNNTNPKQCANILQFLEPLFFDKHNKNNFANLNFDLKYKILLNYFFLQNKSSRDDGPPKFDGENKIELLNKNKLLVFSDLPQTKNKISPRQDIVQEIDLNKMNLNTDEQDSPKEKRKFPSFFKKHKF